MCELYVVILDICTATKHHLFQLTMACKIGIDSRILAAICEVKESEMNRFKRVNGSLERRRTQ